MMGAIARQILRAEADGTPEWMEQRTQGVGGTDAANLVLGLKSRFQMWREKKGLAEPEDVSPELQALFNYGHSREPELARIFKDRTGLRVRNTGTWARKDQSWAIANPDRFVGSDGILEIKTTGAYTDAAKLWREGLVPPRAWVQAHWYAYVTGRTRLYFIAEVDRQPIILGPYDTDPELTARMVEACTEFWSLVEDGEVQPDPTEVPPAPVVIIDGTTHPVEPWADTRTDLVRYLDLKAQIKELTAEVKDLEVSIQAEMGTAEFMTTPDGGTILATNRVGTSTSWDKAAMVADGIDPEKYQVKKANAKATLSVKKEARA